MVVDNIGRDYNMEKKISEKQHAVKFSKFEQDIRQAVNKNSMENYCDMPDFIIAEHLVKCFVNLSGAVTKTKRWHNE